MVFALRKESPRSEPLGLRGEAHLGSVLPHGPAVGCPPQHSGRFGGCWRQAKQEKSLLGEILLQEAENPAPTPPLLCFIRNGEATESAERSGTGSVF